jgi:tRNA(Arg) A34 adenosine deaminase TadA
MPYENEQRDSKYMDAEYMAEALHLAEAGRGLTHPNPRVGALLVRDGHVVGRGAHLGPGTPHAEAAATLCIRPSSHAATRATRRPAPTPSSPPVWRVSWWRYVIRTPLSTVAVLRSCATVG